MTMRMNDWPGKLIFDFALSLMLGNVFQQLHTFADTVIVGRGITR